VFEPLSTIKRARRLRREMTLPEVLLWARLRERAEGRPVFRRQHPRGPYVLDFYCDAAGLCVEVDGAAHGRDDRMRADESRDAWLSGNGVRVLRVAAADVLRDPDQVAAWVVEEALGVRTPLTTAMRERLGRG